MRACSRASGPFPLRHRNREGEPRAQARPVALGPDAAPVRLHYPLADGKAQPRPRNAAPPVPAVYAGELPEPVRQEVRRHAPALVGDGERDVDALLHRRHTDGGPLGVPGRVGKQVAQHLDDAAPVSHDRGQVRRQVDVKVAPLSAAQERAVRRLGLAVHMRGLAVRTGQSTVGNGNVGVCSCLSPRCSESRFRLHCEPFHSQPDGARPPLTRQPTERPRKLAPAQSASASCRVLSRHLARHSHCRPPSVPPKAPADRPPTSRLPKFKPGSSRL